MVLNLILVHFFHLQILIGVKMLLFLEQTVVHQCILLEKKLVFGEGPTEGLDDTTLK